MNTALHGGTAAHSLRTLLVLLFFVLAQLVPVPAHAFYFGGVSLKDEKEMGHKFDVMLRSYVPTVDDPEVRQYVTYIVNRLVKAIPPQPFEFKGTPLLHNAMNAFAVPGGYVFVFSGMIMNVNREEDLAGVLAHELAHVTQRHVASRLERAQVLSVGALLLGIAGIAVGGPAGGAMAVGAMGASQSAMLNYSRVDENEADHIGLQYLVAAGYPPMGMVGGFTVLRQKSWMSGMRIPTYLSTHPALGDRINGLTARIQKMPAHIRDRKSDNTRFKRVQTLLWARYGDAQAALQRFSGKDALSRMGRGMVLARQNNVQAARQAFDEALAAAPQDSLVLRESGIFHYRKGDMKLAEQLLAKAMQRDSRDYMAAFFYARMLDKTGRGAHAVRYYEDVLRHVPEDPAVHEAFARSLGENGRTVEAYIHMTYSNIYAGQRKMSKKNLDKVKGMAKSPAHKAQVEKLEKIYKERKEVWDD